MSALQKYARFVVLAAIAFMVLLIVPSFNDSTNLPKYSVLFIAAAVGVSILSLPKFGLLEKNNWKTWAPPVFFLIVMFVLALLSDQKYIAFFGNYGRNNGWFQYFGLTTLFLLTAFSFNFNSLTKLFHLLAVLGSIVAFYGFSQSRSIDFLNFADTGSPVVATLGNSNFASAFLGFAAVALFWELFHLKKVSLKALSAMGLLGITHVIYVSNSSQGIFVLLIGALMFIGIKFFSSSKKAIGFYFSMFGFATILGIFGLFQIGPLTKFVYQSSTTYRGDYYRAAWKMFESHPLSGVGIDQFGYYYRSYRDANAAFRLGPSSVVDYAHNVFLQILATGGAFLFFAYLICILFVAFAAIKGLKKFKGDDKVKFGALVSLWFAYQVQTQVSVDQITIAGIGWVLAGAIVALGFNSELITEKASQVKRYATRRRRSVPNSSLVAISLALILVVSSFAWLVPIWRADYYVKVARTLGDNPKNLKLVAFKTLLLKNSIALAPHEIRYKIIASEILANNGDLSESRRILFLALADEPRSHTANEYLAQNYEISGDFKSAISTRDKISLLDPYDTNNWFILGKDLVEIGDYQALDRVIQQVASLSSNSTIVDDLKALLPAASTSKFNGK